MSENTEYTDAQVDELIEKIDEYAAKIMEMAPGLGDSVLFYTEAKTVGVGGLIYATYCYTTENGLYVSVNIQFPPTPEMTFIFKPNLPKDALPSRRYETINQKVSLILETDGSLTVHTPADSRSYWQGGGTIYYE